MATVEAQKTGGNTSRLALALRLLNIAVAGTAAFLLFLFLYTALRRIRYPYDVEWIESGMMMAVLRILHHQPLYTAPTPDYVPYLYAPVYFYVAAAMAKLTGPTMAALRSVSIVSTLGSCVTIFLFVLGETRRRLPAIAAAGLFVGCYALAGEFYDIGRVDSLFVFLLLLALLAQRRGYPIAAAVLWSLTALTKQTVLPLAVFILCAEWQRPRRMFLAIGTFIGLTILSVVVGNHLTGGWYSFYIFHIARGLPVLWRGAALFLPHEIFPSFGIALLLALGALLLRQPALKSPRTSFYLFVSTALIGGTWFVASHRGASTNTFMPVYAWIAILFGVALARVLESAGQRTAVLTLSAALMQLLALIYNPGQFIPPPDIWAVRAAFINQLRDIPGKIDMLNHSYDAVLAGKEPQAEGEAFGAVYDSPPSASRTAFMNTYFNTFVQHEYTAIVLDTYLDNDSSAPMRANYRLAIPAFGEEQTFLTSQPRIILFLCSSKPLAASLPHPGVVDDRRCTSDAASPTSQPAMPLSTLPNIVP